MLEVKKCLVVHDLCTYSKSSLTVVIPTMEALQVEACPIATSLLSTQTDGVHHVFQKKLTEEANEIFKVIKQKKIEFDGIYSGYISDVNLIKRLESFIENNEVGFKVIDPVMGDQGNYYQGFSSKHKDSLKTLIRGADLITPNYTEAKFLTEGARDDDLLEELRKLAPKANIVITSYPDLKSKMIYLTKENKKGFFVQDKEKVSLPGSGDFFCSVMTALMLRGEGFLKALEIAATITKKAIHLTTVAGYEVSHGICPIMVLSDLTQAKITD